MSDGTDRVTVSTYVSAAQREAWTEDARALGMSQSEFVRTMVQAGRRNFSLGDDGSNPEEPDVAGSNPRGDVPNRGVLDILQQEGPLGWSSLVEAVIDDIESDLESRLIALQEANRISHSPREGTYAFVEDTGGD